MIIRPEKVPYSTNSEMTNEEYRILILLLYQIDSPQQEVFKELFLSERALRKVLNNSIDNYEEALRHLKNGLMKKTFIFEAGVTLKGKPLEGEIPWFESMIPINHERLRGTYFLFSKQLEPFLSHLAEWM